MAKEKFNIEQFLEEVEVNYQPFVQDLHNYLVNNGCKVAIEVKKSGFFASYKDGASKKSIVNLLFRKAGLRVRIYEENAYKYVDFLATLPEEMVQSVEEATACKRLTNTGDCSPTCSKGYDFTIGTNRFQICRYGGFDFLVTNKNNPYIKSFVENEIRERMAV